MYKVFVNNQSIHFVKNLNNQLFENEKTEIYQYQSKKALLSAIAEFTSNKTTDRLFIYCPGNLTEVFKFFKSQYLEIKAGGALIRNDKNKYLFIYRRGYWDLPKGKLDKGETIKNCAKREAEEETGIDKLQILKKLPETYHIYIENNRKIIKHCYWFLMETNSNKVLKPQLEEDITEVEWLDIEEMNKVINNTYNSVKEILFNNFRNLKILIQI